MPSGLVGCHSGVLVEGQLNICLALVGLTVGQFS